MAIFKCKMCGGDLEVFDGVTVCECEYCGTKQTVPTTQDEVITNLYNRANNLRIRSEFDKAQETYEKIVSKNPEEAEVYWGIVLCKYGIEYVEDPNTFKRVPTCHRTQLESVMTDVDYLSAIEHADSIQKDFYEQEAKAIDLLQKDILSIVHNEKPFDVFICYKETDENGKRTVDSVVANDIYHQLTQEGFKVFYAAITLEDKLGQEYEPYIFAALNSAKVMLAVGTKPEHFNAVWVKNEWSRYIKLMKNDRNRTLIPCYRDMDAYDLPEEFSHLQAQDMGKIGFINDVVRGIKKLIVTEEPKKQETVVVNQTSNASVEPLLKRAFIFLEDKDWDSADEYAEKVLDQDPENAQAYLVKLLSDCKKSNQADLKNCEKPFDSNANFDKICRYDSALGEQLKADIDFINDRNENARLEDLYNKALSVMDKAKAENSFKQAAKQFDEIKEYKDSYVKSQECLDKAKIARKYAIYNDAVGSAKTESIICQERAIKLFNKILGYKDVDDRLAIAQAKLEKLKQAAEEDRVRKEKEAEEKRIRDEKLAEERRIAAEKKAKKTKTNAIIIAIVLVVAIVLGLVVNNAIKSSKYNKATELLASDQYQEAYDVFVELGDYKDSKDQVNSAIFNIQKQNLSTAKKGDIIKIGTYADEEIEWRVLDKKDDKILVITNYIIECVPFNASVHDWEESSLRAWLNNEFYSNSFDNEAKSLIQSTKLDAFWDEGPTENKIFILSDNGAKKYFPSNAARCCKATNNAITNGLYVHNGNGQWWLCTSGHNSWECDAVGTDGKLRNDLDVDADCIGVRPVMWISIE